MRKLLALLIFIISTSESFSQKRPVGDIQEVPGLDTNDTYRLMTLLDLAVNKYTISRNFSDYYCNAIIWEFRDGRVVDSINLRKEIGDLDYAILIDSSSREKFEFSIYSQEIGDSILKFDYIVGNLGKRIKLKLDKNKPYSWKQVYSLHNNKHELKPGELFPLLAYSKPIGEKQTHFPGDYEFCRISGELFPYKEWYKDLDIEHYFIFFIRLEK